VQIGDAVVIGRDGLDQLLGALQARGMRTIGPVVRDGAIVPGEIERADDLPVGWHDEQAPGRYRLAHQEDPELFGWAVGPGSWKAEFFPASETVFRARVEGVGLSVEEPALPAAPTAVVGARPCELAALDVLDRVLGGGAVPDPRYLERRRACFVVATDCGRPSASCFCSSMGTGPEAREGFDLALSEVLDGKRHRFVVRVGSAAGAAVLEELPTTPLDDDTSEARREVLEGAARAMRRSLETEGLPELLARTLEHPRWADVADRCLACGNCTLVCPTCFCSDVDDVSELDGTVERRRRWASCFDLAHSELHSGPVRASTSSRYRQWLTHKLGTWWDQFGTSGCVGCGRCITWCPVGIDLTEEVAALSTDHEPVGAAGP